jgi:hypothetical protein
MESPNRSSTRIKPMHNTTKTRPFFIRLLAGGLLLAVGLGIYLANGLPGGWEQAWAAGAGLLAIAVFAWGAQAFFRRLPRWFPVSTGEELTYTLADQRQFQREYWLVTLLYFAVTPLMVVLAYLALAGLAGLYFRLIPAVYLAPVDPAYWRIPAIFLGISLSGIPIWFFNRWRLKERFPRLVAFFNQQSRYDQRKAGLAFSAVGLAIVLALVMAGLNLYLRLTPDAIAAGRFFVLVEDTHRYDQVTRLQEHIRVDAANPQRVRNHTFLIEFADGSRWRTVSFGSRPVPPIYRQALEYAARRSGRPLETVIE